MFSDIDLQGLNEDELNYLDAQMDILFPDDSDLDDSDLDDDPLWKKLILLSLHDYQILHSPMPLMKLKREFADYLAPIHLEKLLGELIQSNRVYHIPIGIGGEYEFLFDHPENRALLKEARDFYPSVEYCKIQAIKTQHLKESSMGKKELVEVGVGDGKGNYYNIGELVTFKSEYQHGTAILEDTFFENYLGVVLKGVDVRSKWGQAMQPGNAIMGPVSLITGKADNPTTLENKPNQKQLSLFDERNLQE